MKVMEEEEGRFEEGLHTRFAFNQREAPNEPWFVVVSVYMHGLS